MRLPSLPAAARKVRRVLASRLARATPGAILLYHRVAHVDVDPWDLAVSPERFERQMEMLAGGFDVLPLRELSDRARRRDLPPGAVAVTFDDGYMDNLEVAKPILDRLGIPATVFVATSFAAAERAYWWDELDALVTAAAPHDELEVPMGDGVRRWPTGTEPERRTALAEMQTMLRSAGPLEIREVLDTVREWAGDAGRKQAPRPMAPSDLDTLTASGLVEVGAHTRLHRSLGEIDAAHCLDEVAGSRDDLAEWLGAPPRAFSYPYGSHGGPARRALRGSGFDLAVTTELARVTWMSDRLALPRAWVRDQDEPEDLEARLRGLLRMADA